MLNVSRPLHRLLVVGVCVMFAEALAVPISAAAQGQFVCNQVIGLTLTREYAGLKRIDLMTVVRGPRNQGCPAPPATDEYIAMPQEFDAALAGVAKAIAAYFVKHQ
jgi:hypothetical protein